VTPSEFREDVWCW